MKKRIAFALFVLMLSLLSGCAQANKNLVWYEDFGSADSADAWKPDVDMNYVCDVYDPPSSADTLFQPIQAFSPSGDNKVGAVLANPLGKNGLNVNNVTHRRFEVIDKSTYILTGYMKAAPGYDLEMIDPALEFCLDGTCWYAEIDYYFNKYVNQETHMEIGDPYYAGLMYTRGPSSKNMNFLMEMGVDNAWHFFVLQVSVDLSSDTPYVFDRVMIDYFVEEAEENLKHNFVNKYFDNVPLWLEKKAEGYADGGQVFLEVHNMNTNCLSENSFVGVGLWDDIALYRYPLGDAPLEIVPGA